MKRFFVRTAALILAAVSLYVTPAGAISAQKAIVLDAATGRVLYEKRSDEKSLIASTTKIMTALVVCQQCNVLDRVRIPKEAVGIEGSSMYLRQGEVLTVQELLYGLMLQSGNDAAVALAIYCGGTVEGFAQLMNDKARYLGLKDTNFVNPHGLDHPEHYSTARDLAVLAAYAMEDPIFRKTVSTKSVRIGDRQLSNHNRLLWQVEGADGVKTGFTKAAGRILVSSAVRSGRRLVVVTIDDGDDWRDHAALYAQGFSRYRMEKIVAKGDCLGYLPVLGGQQETEPIAAAEDFSYPIADGEKVYIRFSQKGFVYAPVTKNGDAGLAYICLGGKVIGKIGVVFACSSAEREEKKPSLWERLTGGAA